MKKRIKKYKFLNKNELKNILMNEWNENERIIL